MTAGHWQWTFQLTTTASTPVSTTFNVTLAVNKNGAITYGIVYVANSGTNTSGQTINCIFDIGTSMTTPLSYTFTVK